VRNTEFLSTIPLFSESYLQEKAVITTNQITGKRRGKPHIIKPHIANTNEQNNARTYQNNAACEIQTHYDGNSNRTASVFNYSRLHENKMSTDRKNMRGYIRARVTRGSRNPNHGKRKHYIVHIPSGLN
jgi:hypothetical protein